MNSNKIQINSFKRRNIRKKTLEVFTYVLLIIGALIMATPFLWMLSTSLKETGAVFKIPPEWIPEVLIWDNYRRVIQDTNIFLGFRNTFCVIIPTTALGVFSSCMAAYGFAKIQFPARQFFFFLLLSTIMIPGVVTMIPAFLLFKTYGWLDTWLPLMIPGMFGSAAAVFMLRQFFLIIPKELSDAARIDGMGHMKIFSSIILPLSRPAVAAQVLFGFIAGYNDFMGPLIYINNENLFTLQLVLASFQGYYSSDWTLIMAGAVIALIPTVVIFFFAQKYFIEGIVMTGMKA